MQPAKPSVTISVIGVAVLTALGAGAYWTFQRGQSLEKTYRVDTRYFDSTVRPQDDLYRYVNGKWLDTVAIPADKSRYGAFHVLDDETEVRLHNILAGLQTDSTIASGTDAQKLRDLYTSFMNEPRLEELGAQPLAALLGEVDAINDAKQLPVVMASLVIQGIDAPMFLSIHSDNRDSTHYVPDLVQSGLELPDRDYYLKDGEDGTYKTVRQAYEKHIVTMWSLAKLAQPEETARKILALETEIARLQWDQVTNRDPVKGYNRFEIVKLAALAPQIDWLTYAQAIGISGKSDVLLVHQPSYIAGLAKLLNSTPLESWKSYLKWKVISGGAPYLSKTFVDESFAFRGKIISGTPENPARWKRALGLIDGATGEALGKRYVQQFFPEEHKRHMLTLVNNLIAAYRQSITQLDWMSDTTKQQAQNKLSKLVVKIGYPDQWRDYSPLEIKADDLWGNVIRANQFGYQRQLNKLGKPIDRSEWQISPQTINAYYNPEMNEIVFPAGILQPPFFDMQSDDALNYGAIGGVIGHEISHGFDDQGSQFDGDGNLRDWWTKEDHEKFAAKTNSLIEQYAAYESVPGYHVNGNLTLGENIADLSGLAIAFKAYQLSLNGKTAPIINGFSGEQRFFFGWATVWQAKSRDQEAIRLVTIDPHSPPQFRVQGTVVNMNAFYQAFDVKPGDKMYAAPEKRLSIW